MSRRSPYVIVLSDADRAVLEARARAYTAPLAEVVRAKIVLLAAEGRAEHGDRRAGGRACGRGEPVAEAVRHRGVGGAG